VEEEANEEVEAKKEEDEGKVQVGRKRRLWRGLARSL
jgi:hypothetical protein